MPFNALTYRMNQSRQERDKHLAAARDIMVRAAKGEAYEWEMPRIARFVSWARSANRLYLSYKREKAIKDAMRPPRRRASTK
jgi:hypothetical protein